MIDESKSTDIRHACTHSTSRVQLIKEYKYITSSANHRKISTTKMKSIGKGYGKNKTYTISKIILLKHQTFYRTDKIKQEETDHRFILWFSTVSDNKIK